MLQCSALTWDVANSDVMLWWLSPVSPFPPPVPSHIEREHIWWGARRGWLYKAHRTLCARKHLSNECLRGGRGSSCDNRDAPFVFWSYGVRLDQKGDREGKRVISCFCLNSEFGVLWKKKTWLIFYISNHQRLFNKPKHITPLGWKIMNL